MKIRTEFLREITFWKCQNSILRIISAIFALLCVSSLIQSVRADIIGVEYKVTGTADDSYSEIPSLPGFLFWDIRNSGTLCISDAYDRRSGESITQFGSEAYGSMEYSLESSADKAGFTYIFPEPFPFSELLGGGYDWYRDAISDNPPAQSPALFFTIDADGDEGTTDDRFGLKYEAIYNGITSPMPEDTWVTAVIGSTTNLWSHNAPEVADRFVFNITLSDWQTEYPDATVLLVGCDAGSGWDGVFKGAVDLIQIETPSGTQTFDFELVPDFRPDVTVGEKFILSSHKGDDSYESRIDQQLVKIESKFKRKAKAFYSVGNDGNRGDIYNLRGTGKNSRSVKSKYFLIRNGGRLNITGQLVRTGLNIGLVPNEVVLIRGELELKGSAKKRVRKSERSFNTQQDIVAISIGDPFATDTAAIEVEFFK